MRTIVSTFLGLTLLFMPFAASADTLIDPFDQIRFLLSHIAASKVHNDLSKPSCVVLASAQSVRVNERFILAWGSSGMDEGNTKNIWTPNGITVVALDTPGIYRYGFDFFGKDNTKTSCEVRVTVS